MSSQQEHVINYISEGAQPIGLPADSLPTDPSTTTPRATSEEPVPQALPELLAIEESSGITGEADISNKTVTAAGHAGHIALLEQDTHDLWKLVDEKNNALAAKDRELAQKEEEKQRLHYDSTHDKLTGLGNLNDLHEKIVSGEVAPGDTVVLADLDGFKKINDEAGHNAGDKILKLFAEQLTSVIREGDHVFRIGGDEFLVIVKDIPQENTTSHPSNERRGRRPATHSVTGEELVSRLVDTVMTGINDEPIDTLRAILQKGYGVSAASAKWLPSRSFDWTKDVADKRMYRIKNKGKNDIPQAEEHWFDLN